MSITGEYWPWLAIALLGAYHGINPGLGWLFAIAWGLQEKRRSAIFKALVPIALGHEASVALVVILARAFELVTAPDLLRPVAAVALILFGLFKFLRPSSHPRGFGMRVSLPELAVWSFLMSSAHGAGLMLFPALLGLSAGSPGEDHDRPEAGLGTVVAAKDMAAVVLHTLAMLAVMTAVALVVYERLGVAILRQAWLNLDVLWALALIVAGVVTLFT